MKNKNIKIIIIVVICIVILLGIGLFIFNKFKDNNVNNDHEYIINYKYTNNDNLDGYEIYIDNEYNVKVIKVDEEYVMELREDNKSILKDFVNELFKDVSNNTIKIYGDELEENDKKIINAIINNNEIYMNALDFKIVYKERNCEELYDLTINGKYLCSLSCAASENINIKLSNGEEFPLERILSENILSIEELNEEGLRCRQIKDKVEKNLVFEIYSAGLNCITPRLYVYDDNTYEFYDTYTSGDTLVPKTGTYNYDVNNILKNINKYSEDNYGTYTLTDNNGNSYGISDTNLELMEFLTSININLDVCSESAN